MCATHQTFPYLKSASNVFEENNKILSLRFPQKLWKIINECDSGAIRWGSSGKTILIDYKKFQGEYLNSKFSFFKTKNITSFIRQLNLYGFRKVTSYCRDPRCNSNYPDIHEFIHEGFQYGRLDMLSQVSRKNCGNKSKIYDLKFNRFAIDVGKLRNDVSIIFKKKPKSRLLFCTYTLHEAVHQCRTEKHWETEDPLADIVNSNSTDAVSELFGFDFNAIPNAEASMEWINSNSNLLSTDYCEPEEISSQPRQKTHCLESGLNESTFSKYIPPPTCIEGNLMSHSFDEHSTTIKMEPDVAIVEERDDPVINIPDNNVTKVCHSNKVKSNILEADSARLKQRNVYLTLFPKKTYVHVPVRDFEFQDNFYLQLTKAYRLF